MILNLLRRAHLHMVKDEQHFQHLLPVTTPLSTVRISLTVVPGDIFGNAPPVCLQILDLVSI